SGADGSRAGIAGVGGIVGGVTWGHGTTAGTPEGRAPGTASTTGAAPAMGTASNPAPTTAATTRHPPPPGGSPSPPLGPTPSPPGPHSTKPNLTDRYHADTVWSGMPLSPATVHIGAHGIRRLTPPTQGDRVKLLLVVQMYEYCPSDAAQPR